MVLQDDEPDERLSPRVTEGILGNVFPDDISRILGIRVRTPDVSAVLVVAGCAEVIGGCVQVSLR